MITTLSALAAHLGLPLRGEDGPFTGLNTLEAATETEVSFLANPRYLPQLLQTKAAAVIIAEKFADQVSSAIVSENPYFDFARASALFTKRHCDFKGISSQAFIHPTATVEAGCTIYPFVYISEGARIGEGCTLYPGVFIGIGATVAKRCILYPNCVIMAEVMLGNDCTIQAGAVIGTDGFGFTRVAGTMQKVPQIGTVTIEDGVDIGANSCIDRATLSTTHVGKDSKIDNLVQLGHNVSLGEQCLIISQVGIAGSTRLGDRVTVAGQAGLAGHLTIGDDVVIGSQSGVPKDIPANTIGSGTPFMDGSTFRRVMVLTPNLPTMNNRLQALEKQVAALKALTNRETE